MLERRMITVTDDNGTEIFLSESLSKPGATQIVIIGPSPQATQRVIEDLIEEWGDVHFTVPAQCQNGQWTAVGLVGGGS